MQGVLQEVIKSGALCHLDADQQWSLRMLLPRGTVLSSKPAQAAPTASAAVNMDGNAVLQPAAAGAAAAPAQPLAENDKVLTLLTATLAEHAAAFQVC